LNNFNPYKKLGLYNFRNGLHLQKITLHEKI
jgi:hypothetical protein